MKPIHFPFLTLLALAGCGPLGGQQSQTTSPAPAGGQADKAGSLPEARRGFQTKVIRRESDREPAPQPPPRLFRMVRYDAPVGPLAGYLTPDPKDGKKHPAIIW